MGQPYPWLPSVPALNTWGAGMPSDQPYASPVAVGILGTGSYLPAREVTNTELATLVPEVEPEWITRKTLIEARRFAAAEEAASDLAAKAAIPALERAGITAGDLDYLIVSTSTGDSPQPPTANLVQDLIGADRAACFDVNVVCAGFVFALSLARSLVALQPGAKVLVVAADVYSRILDFSDRRTAVLFGDGAGAAVVGAVPEGYGIVATELVSRGAANQLIRVEAGGSRLPASAETVANGAHFFRMDGRGVRDFVADHVPPVLAGMLERAGLHGRGRRPLRTAPGERRDAARAGIAGPAGRRHHAPDADPVRQRGQRVGAGRARRGRPFRSGAGRRPGADGRLRRRHGGRCRRAALDQLTRGNRGRPN